MKTSLKLFGVLVVFILSSCEKNETEPFFDSDIPLLYQVYYDSEKVYEYTYNEANLIFEEKSKYYYTKHHYDDNLLTSSDYYVDQAMFSSSSYVLEEAEKRVEWVSPENTVKSNTNNFYYNEENQLIRTISNNSNYSEFTYNEEGKIIRQTFFHEQKASGFREYEYDDSGNLIKNSHYYILESGVFELQTTTEYLFDNKYNPYKTFASLRMPGKYTNTNNIIKETYTLYFEVDAFIDQVQVTENTYEYDQRGYPVKKNGYTFIYK